MSEAGFAITETLGRDENSVLYRALRREDRRPVVLKVLGHGTHLDKELEHLRNELELAGELDHLSVLHPLMLVIHEGVPALVSEDFAGVPLKRLLGRPMTVGRFLKLATAIAGALEQVHRAGLVHKDLTPGNVFVNQTTNEIRLCGFGLASRLPRQPPVGQPPELIEGALPFMSPEQTGRVNRAVDSRSDLYSLGVLFFIMLTGKLPFVAHDPLGWVHAHVARPVPPVDELAPDVPPIVAAIVGRLMEKMPEDRYQSARGLRHDLERARAAGEAAPRLEPFPLGELDVSDRLKLPQRLYGREAELASLQQVLDQTVSTGRPALALISGYAGVGKSVLVHELLRSIEGARGIFLSGKFDVLQRNIPYSTFAQAFRRALQDLQGAGVEQKATWRARMRDAIGNNGRLIAEIVPETEQFLGPQPPSIPLSPMDAEGRFLTAFQAFITAFGTAEHPLVLFLDDLQWADVASLKLLRMLLTTPETRHLLVFGAYRDNEVEPSHPLWGAIDQIRQAGVRVKEIELGTLSVEHVVAFTADAVRRPTEEVRALGRLVFDKTAGNPFFIMQFFRELVRSGLLSFDAGEWRWRWDLERIHDRGYSDDVAAFMVGRIEHLPAATRQALRLAACVGNAVDLDTLAALALTDEASIRRDLLPAIEQGLVSQPLGQATTRFAHDRVQQAAYSQVKVSERPALHLRIGRLLLEKTPPDALDDRIFEIVNQLIQGRSLVEGDERTTFAALILRAGRKAIAAGAHAAARSYLTAGVDMLPANAWEDSYELAFGLRLETARAALFSGDHGGAQQMLERLHGRPRRAQDEAAIAIVEVYLLTVLGRMGEAVEVMRRALRRYGLDLPPHPAWEQVTRKYAVVLQAIQQHPHAGSIERLVNLPRAEDEGIVALADLLAMLLIPALLTDENLMALLALTAVELSLHHGISDATASACILVAMVAGARLGRYDEAEAFGRLGRAIVDVRGLVGYRAKVYLDFALVNQWSHPLRTNVDILQQAWESARATGNFAVAVYSLNNLVSLSLSLGTPLPDVQRQIEEALPFARWTRYLMVERVLVSQLRLVLNLRGLTERFGTFDGNGFDESSFEAGLEADPHYNASAICFHLTRKLQARFLSGDYEEAYATSVRARPLLWTSRSFMETPEYHLYTALAVAALCDLRSDDEKPALVAELREKLKLFRVWAKTCPANFLHKLELIEGERCRVQGDGLGAMRHYEEAMRAAGEAGMVQNQAIACELAARFCRAAGLASAAALYLAEARQHYEAWGADGKVQQLDRELFEAKAETRRAPLSSPAAAAPEELDLLAVAKASQAISMELSWERVARRLLEVALEQGGADRGCLLVRRAPDLFVAADARVDRGGVTTRLIDPPVPAPVDEIPIAVAEFVGRTRERVMLDDPATDGAFTGDPYIRRHKPRSLLCLPIASPEDVVGILYLENRQVSGAFTPGHLLALEVVAAQAAIALANAELFAKLERENAERRRAETFLEESRGKLQQIIDNSAAAIFVKDVEGRYLLSNRAFDDLFGFERGQVNGKTDRYLPIEGAVDIFHENDLRALQQGHAVEFDESVTVNGVLHDYLSIKFPLFDPSGHPYAVCGIATDITARKRVAEQLRDSVSLLQATLESTGDAILVVDRRGCVVQFNSRFSETWGIGEEQLRDLARRHGAPFDTGLLRDREAFYGLLARLAEHPESSSADIVEFGDGRIFECYTQPQRMDERVVGRVWSFRDVTTRIRAERERDRLLVDERKARASAEQAVRVRDEFLSVASHELRTPLTSLQLVIQRLLRRLGPEVGGPVGTTLELSQRQLRRLGGLVELLLDVSRIQAGRLELDRHMIDLRVVVAESVAQLTAELSRSGSGVTVHASEPVVGFWDASRMEQLFINLLTNAIKFGKRNPIDVTLGVADGMARLEVADGGIGMPPEVQERIFQRYERGVSARHYGGLGLGLYIVRTIVEAHGGRVSVTSSPGTGSRFTVDLPVWPSRPDRALAAVP